MREMRKKRPEEESTIRNEKLTTQPTLVGIALLIMSSESAFNEAGYPILHSSFLHICLSPW